MTKALAPLLVLLCAVPAHAQVPDSRWEPFLGCWDLLAEEAPRPFQAPGRSAGTGAPVPRAEVCVEPSAGGVTLVTSIGNRAALRQQIIADGTDRPVTEGTCQGTERAEWSRDGRRLFSRGRLTCQNEPLRSVSALSLFAPDGRWIDVQAVTVGGREIVRVRQYRATTPRDGGTSRAPGAPLSLDDVVEASRHVMPGVVEAAIIETRARFALSGRALIALDDANVPDSVTDLMVALSYPEAFVIERRSRDDRLTRFDPIGMAGTWDDWNPFWGYAGLSPYDPYFGSAYYYSPFGFRYLGAYPAILASPALLGSGAAIARGDGGGSPDRPREEPGRVINRQGYTRVLTTRAAETAESGSQGASSGGRTTSSTRGTASPRGYTSSGDGSGGGAASGGSGGASSGGGNSGGGTGRTAVPR